MSKVKRYYVGKYGLVEGEALGRLGVVLVADYDRVDAERDALQAALIAKDQRVDDLEAALKFYADREHYHFESGNWDTVSGEPLNILWCGYDPDFIEDGTVARVALKPTPKPACCGSCPAGCTIGAKP
ncbi:hypothetical protein [Pseudomonas chlororaphis]|uniref:hypothetical protein n=1 Tax=Pseudomonas chlororaphis TaxID=587753 RepID=UPI001675329B|nr:hypothetical protein [Pseudomonas chlororaphis]